MANQVVAIDGPAAAGKSTVARLLAQALGALLFDTGALYRAVTLVALRDHIPVSDEPALARIPTDHTIDVRPASVDDGRLYDVLLDGADVTWATRSAAVDANVSAVSAHPAVRQALLPVQRRIALSGPVVMVGRDVGSVVVPDASLKLYLDASLEERARRRGDELRERGSERTATMVLDDLRRRDAADAGRPVAPLLAAPDAVRIDTEGMSVPEVVAAVLPLVKAAWQEPANA